MMKKAIWLGLALSLVGLVSASSARADEWNKKTKLTFSQAVEIPGHVLPAGTYTFKLMDSMTDRHIVQVFNEDESQIIATILAIPDIRLKATEDTLIKFGEVPAGSPEVIRAWFYPGNTTGNEFVYSKVRAAQLAKASNLVVPAMAVDATTADELKTTSVVAISPDEKESAWAAPAQTTPTETTTPAVQAAPMTTTTPVVPAAPMTMTPPAMQMTAPVSAVRTDTDDKELPKTASSLPLIALSGFAAIGIALGLMAFGKRTSALSRWYTLAARRGTGCPAAREGLL